MLTTIASLATPLMGHQDEDGQGLAEYALILALIAVVAILAILFLGSQISNKLDIIGNAV